MLRKTLASLALVFVFAAPSLAQDKDGWIVLLGPDMGLDKNWITKGNWTLDRKEGVVTLEPRKGESGWTRYDMYLWAKQSFANFEIDFEYKVEKAGNSGFYYKVGDVKDPVKSGIEVQIYDTNRKPGEKLTDHDSGGIIASGSKGVPPTKNSAKPAGEWNRFQITAKGETLKVVLNGETVNELTLSADQMKGRGTGASAIGFQDHGLPLALRNIRIREIK